MYNNGRGQFDLNFGGNGQAGGDVQASGMPAHGIGHWDGVGPQQSNSVGYGMGQAIVGTVHQRGRIGQQGTGERKIMPTRSRRIGPTGG